MDKCPKRKRSRLTCCLLKSEAIVLVERPLLCSIFSIALFKMQWQLTVKADVQLDQVLLLGVHLPHAHSQPLAEEFVEAIDSYRLDRHFH